ncbi:hypothetical protein PAPYR_5007 [Paratrimastix pyriformis]|uniref:EGF-like domain-containing protein n=1 Tax=Paratrimastix pyriformis TaxID=342808 RepID=A0ABQ8UNW8_9EUKA|nr:hypothetical protein PAPYR_5007 [Paratrimastix pyriformis]
MNTDGTDLHPWGSMFALYVTYMTLVEQTSGTWLLWSTQDGGIFTMPLLPDAVPYPLAGGLIWPFQIAPLLWGNCGENDLCSGHGQCTGDGCHCELGWMGTDCSVGMEPLECPNGCSGHGTCNQWTGYCTCEPGFEQPDCHPAYSPVICPAQFFFPATYTTAEVVGDELQLLTHGYNISKYVIARGPPPEQTNPHCILPPVLNQPDPSDLCIIDMSTSVLISELALCPDVVVTTVDNGATTLEYSIPMHVLSMVRTGIDPEGVPVIGWRYQSMDILLVQTIALNLTTSVHVMHLVNYTSFEKGDSYFDHSNADFTFHFTTWTNQHYTQTGLPFLNAVPPTVDPAMITIVADHAADDCADPVRFCAHGWVMTIAGLQSPCQVAGRFIIGEHIECSDPALCPRDAAGDFFGIFDINPGTCDVALVNITVTGQLWVDMTDQGTALAWGRRASVLGQLSAQSVLSAANMAYLRVCTLPHAGTACPDGSYQILIADNAMAPLAVQLEGIYTHDTMNYNLSMVFDLLAFHYSLAVDTNPNLITELQFDAHWNGFVPGHISESAYQAKLRTKLRGPKARSVTWGTRSPLAAATGNGDEDQGPLVTQSPVDYSFRLAMTGGDVDPLPSPPTPVTPGGMSATTVAAISAGAVVGVFAIVGAVATVLAITRRLHARGQAKTGKQPKPQADAHKES